MIVVLNFADRRYDAYRIGFPRGGSWRVRLNSDWRGYSSIFTRSSGNSIPLHFRAKTLTVCHAVGTLVWLYAAAIFRRTFECSGVTACEVPGTGGEEKGSGWVLWSAAYAIFSVWAHSRVL